MNAGLKRLLTGLLLLLLAAGGLVLLYRTVSPSWSWNQKLTVTMDSAQGPLAADSITRASLGHDKLSFGHPGGLATHGLHGEAVVLDLGGGRHVFALIGGMATLAQFVVLTDEERRNEIEPRARLLQQVGRKGAVTRQYYPMLVTFDDITDPKTVKRVDPDDMDGALGLCPDGSGLKDADAPWRGYDLTWRQWTIWRDSGLSLGKFRREQRRRSTRKTRDTSGDCHRLTGMTLEITDEPVTRGEVEAVLGWIIAAKWLIPPDKRSRVAQQQTVEQRVVPSNFIDGWRLKLKRERKWMWQFPMVYISDSFPSIPILVVFVLEFLLA